MISAILFVGLSLPSGVWSVRLNPLENNDKLQDINNQYVAEWQWESWSIKQDSSEQDGRSPGPRLNVALWMDDSGPNWYLFGGRPVNADLKKVYSDVWKYSVDTRLWERFFPSQAEVKGTNAAKIGGMMSLRANLFDETQATAAEARNQNVILCGGVAKTNVTNSKKQNVWSNFTRRKKQEEKEKKELRSLAVYAPKTSKSNTVWQIDMKDKLWTAYVCCCDTSNGGKKEPAKQSKLTTSPSGVKAERSQTTANASEPTNVANATKVNAADTYEDVALKNKKKKINQSKKLAGNVEEKSNAREKRSDTRKENATAIGTADRGRSHVEDTTAATNKNEADGAMTKKEKYNLKIRGMIKGNRTETPMEVTKVSEKSETAPKPKTTSQYCPEFSPEVEPVTWCDGNNEMLITADISLPEVTLWIFNLKTSHWSQKLVQIAADVVWPGCSVDDSVRYAGNVDEVYIFCSPALKEENVPEDISNASTTHDKNPSKKASARKAAYRINYKDQVLQSLGEIEMSAYFATGEGRVTWNNESKSLLQVVRTPQNETILLLAYEDFVDLWILTTSQLGKNPHFDVVEKVWRGSALKWFNKYNSPVYNFQFTAESANSAKTILMANPRQIGLTEYWPRDRGRFIIRVFRNENLKNRTFENRTREQNLTYELLQSDYKPQGGSESQLSRTYSFKVLVFFGISLAIFTAFGIALFLKRYIQPWRKSRNNADWTDPVEQQVTGNWLPIGDAPFL